MMIQGLDLAIRSRGTFFVRVLTRWANARGFSVEWFAVCRPDYVRWLARCERDGGLSVRVRKGGSEGHIVEVVHGVTPVVRAKTFAGWHDAWILAGELTAALSSYARRGAGRFHVRLWTYADRETLTTLPNGRPSAVVKP